MAELNHSQKKLIVLLLAQFNRPAEVVAILREEHGIEGVTVRQVMVYDPTRDCFDAGQWVHEMFWGAREEYLKETAKVPIANQGFRLAALQRTYDKAVKSGNVVLANATLKQAAEEVGGALTNERNVKVTRSFDELSNEERRKEVGDIIGAALDRVNATAPSTGKVQ